MNKKQIKEAAEKYMLEQFYSKGKAEYPIECGEIDRQCQNDFIAGINWFLDNLWHDASEEPKLGKRVLVKINGNLSLFNSGFVVERIRNFEDCYGIESWLYIDDLLKGENK